jgi:hypothetical protein
MRAISIATALAAALCWAPVQSQPTDAPAAASAAPAQTAEAMAAAQRVLALSQADDLARNIFRSQVAGVIGQLQQNAPDLPGRAFVILEEEFDRIEDQMVDELVLATAVMYAERFTVAELGELAAFYESSAGQKALLELPKLANAGMVQGREIGERLGEVAATRALDRMDAEGLLKKP